MIVEIKNIDSDSKIAINLKKVACMTLEKESRSHDRYTCLIVEFDRTNKTVLSSKFYDSKNIEKIYNTWVRPNKESLDPKLDSFVLGDK